MFCTNSSNLGSTNKPHRLSVYSEPLKILWQSAELDKEIRKLLKQAMPSLIPSRVVELSAKLVKSYRDIIPEYTKSLIKYNPFLSRNEIEQYSRSGILKSMVKEVGEVMARPDVFKPIEIISPMVSAIHKRPALTTTYYDVVIGTNKRAIRVADIGLTKTGLISEIARKRGFRPASTR